MGTHATIIAKKENSYRSIYNHYDGYPEYLFKMLTENYTDDGKVQRLIDLGDVSSVREQVDIPEGVVHNFVTPADNITIAYGRDRGETGIECKVYDTLQDALDDGVERYSYLWDGDKWSQI